MTTITKTYVFKLPVTMKEFAKGQRYAVCKMTTNDVSIINMNKSTEEDKITYETRKELNLAGILPSCVKKVLNEDAFVVEEYSRTIETILVTQDGVAGLQMHDVSKFKQSDKIIEREEMLNKFKEKDGDIQTERDKTINIIEDEDKGKDVEGENEHVVEVRNVVDSILKDLSCSDLGQVSFTKYKNKYFNEKKFQMSIETKSSRKEDFGGEGRDDKNYEKFDYSKKKVGGHDEFLYVYKTVKISVNSFGLGWIAKKINQGLKDQLIDFMTNTLQWYDDWSKMSEEELSELEKVTFKKLVKKLK